MDISSALRKVRKDSGLSQGEFAAKAGITQTYVSLIEGGRKVPSVEVIQKYETIGKIPLAIILWWGIQEKDVPKNKKVAFRELKPLVDNLISQIF
jgi:XRE family transcriptional regulator, regulator of sulfur utilization